MKQWETLGEVKAIAAVFSEVQRREYWLHLEDTPTRLQGATILTNAASKTPLNN